MFGAAFIAAPQLASGTWLGKDAKRTGVHVLGRAFGARDLALGAGTLAAMRGGQPVRTWLLAGLVADGADLAATLAARDRLPDEAVPLIGALAGVALLIGALNLASGDDAPQPQV